MVKPLKGGAPPVISLFIIPINYRYNLLINPRYWIYKPTKLTMGHHLVLTLI